MPKWWFFASVKVIAPVLLVGFFCWNMYTLIFKNHGIYGAADGYSGLALGRTRVRQYREFGGSYYDGMVERCR